MKVKVAVYRKSLLALLCLHLWADFKQLHTNVDYGNILDNFVFQHYRAKVKVTVAVIRSLFWPSHLGLILI